jgi:hypothetical protein
VGASAPSAADRADFGTATVGQGPVSARIVFSNTGLLAMSWSSSPRIVGPQADEFGITASGCIGGQPLAAGASCEIGIMFRPAAAATGLRTAALQVDHDWVGGTAAVALLGTAESSAAVAPVGSSGGGGAIGGALFGLLVAAGRCRAGGRHRAAA